jgi:2-C-methyl-D-erythritol 4-phosphate cytidylyltransferase
MALKNNNAISCLLLSYKTPSMKTIQQCKVSAIIPAAGLGKRFGPGKDKPFRTLGGKPLILWPLEALQSIPGISEIIPVLRLEDTESGRELFERYGITKIKRIAPGGKERQHSVYNGLKLIDDKYGIVVIHDGARPLVKKEFIEEMLTEMVGSKDAFDGIIPGVPVKDTIKEAENGMVKTTLKRDNLWAVQTPQIFRHEKILQAYEQAMKKRYYATDDAALVEKYGGKIRIIMGSYRNIKITTQEDLIIAEALLRENWKS